MNRRLIVATYNQGKLREIKELLKELNLDILSLNDLSREKIKIIEDGKSFFDNAYKKAKISAALYKDTLVVGEDSGLEVDFLSGRPGVFSQRYAGENARDEDNNKKLLKELEGVPFEHRTARYRCVTVLMKNNSLLETFEGIFEGYIAFSPRGNGGFGYDPLFYLPEYDKTVAELSLDEKNKLSHRAQAFIKMKKFLRGYLASNNATIIE